MTATAFVDWGLLGRVVLVAVLAGVGIVVVFSFGLVALSYARATSRGRLRRAAALTGAAVAGGALVGALWWGLLLITTKV